MSGQQGYAPDSCWDPVAQKIVVVYSDSTSSGVGKMVAGTIASNAVTWGTVQQFFSSNCGRATSVVHHSPSGKNIIVWTEANTPDYTRACTATLSGTTFTLGGTVVVSRNVTGGEVASRISGALYDATAEKVLVAFGDDQGHIYGTSVSLIIDGNTITPSDGYRFSDFDGIHDGWVTMAHDPDSGQAVSTLSAKGVAGEWNQYSLSIANQGQDTDSAQLIAQSVPPDWEIRFEYGDLYDGSIIVDGIPRQGEGSNVVNVTVWAKPAQGGDCLLYTSPSPRD